MTKKERMLCHLRAEPVDRIPMVGGWVQGVRNLVAIAGITIEEYLQDPYAGVVKANRALDVDGVVSLLVPKDVNEIRAGSVEESNFASLQPETIKERADQTAGTVAGVLASFNAVEVEQQYRNHFESLIKLLGDIVSIPTHWEIPVDYQFSYEYGYVAFLEAMCLYPEAFEKLYWADSITKHAQNTIFARLMVEYDLPPMLFTGCDICDQSGPMCSPSFLQSCYWPRVKYAIEPLLDADIRVMHHCDGNVMPILDDMVAAGFSGFQGFQYECGIDIRNLRQRRSLKGEEMLILGGLSVTRTLPNGTKQDVRDEIDYCLDCTNGGRGFFLFTSNVIGPEVPPDNIIEGYRYLASYDPRSPSMPNAKAG